MAYAEYSDYTRFYGGTMIAEADFTRLSYLASAYIDNITFGQAANASDTDKRKLACCALAEEYQRQEHGGEITSVNNDGYSESYAASGKTAAQRLQEIAACILAPTGLLYGGVW